MDYDYKADKVICNLAGKPMGFGKGFFKGCVPNAIRCTGETKILFDSASYKVFWGSNRPIKCIDYDLVAGKVWKLFEINPDGKETLKSSSTANQPWFSVRPREGYKWILQLTCARDVSLTVWW